MVLLVDAIPVPLRMDNAGTIRVGRSRVTLDTIIISYQQGDTPERIAEGFPTVSLADIYAVISYYLRNRDEVDAYLEQGEEQAGALRRDRSPLPARRVPPATFGKTPEERSTIAPCIHAPLSGRRNFDGHIFRGIADRKPDIDIVARAGYRPCGRHGSGGPRLGCRSEPRCSQPRCQDLERLCLGACRSRATDARRLSCIAPDAHRTSHREHSGHCGVRQGS